MPPSPAAVAADSDAPSQEQGGFPVWMFGYGSIMWNPDVPHVDTVDGYISPFRRVFYQASTEHRGSDNLPGRVATLMQPADIGETAEPHDPSWRVYGRAFRLPDERAAAILEDMKERESVGYHHTTATVYAPDGTMVVEHAACNVADVKNALWRGRTAEERDEAAVAAVIARAQGPSGPNAEYLIKLDEALTKMGFGDDAHVRSLMGHLERLRGNDGGECGKGGGKEQGEATRTAKAGGKDDA